jgi:hypothetical protein
MGRCRDAEPPLRLKYTPLEILMLSSILNALVRSPWDGGSTIAVSMRPQEPLLGGAALQKSRL